MEPKQLQTLLESVQSGRCSVEEAIEQLRHLPFEDLGFAKIDHHRALRQGFPEVILAEGKTQEQVLRIAERLLAQGSNLLVTRVSETIAAALCQLHPEAEHNALARTVSVVINPLEEREGILVVSAGTSDLPVAEEAVETARIMGNKVERLYDVGVAGIHRLLENRNRLFNARVLIVVAGMEGALASVVGGLVDKPVIAVPTSVGYGASFGGLAALLTMLNSCASGVSVVNIDNGFGAGYIAALINRL